MTTSLIDAESVLAIDLGSQFTRAILFDVVDGQYSFIAAGNAPSTVEAPYCDIGEGVNQAIVQLQKITGQTFIGPDGQIILPSQASGTGVDRLVLTYSAGPVLRVVAAGLLSDVSLASAQRLVSSIYGQVVETIGMNDRRKAEIQIDAIIKSQPDLVVIAGGTEGGASRSVYKLVDLVNLTCRVLPEGQRPEIIYAGNQALAKRIKDNLQKWTTVTVVPNIRPSIDSEDLGAAQQILNQAVTRQRTRQIAGVESLALISSTPPQPSAGAFSRLIRLLNQAIDPSKGVLGIDLGNAYTVITAAAAGNVINQVAPYGMGRGVAQVLKQLKLPEIMQWLPIPLPSDFVRDYLWQKSLLPNNLPQDYETLAVDHALARAILRLVTQQFQSRNPEYNRAMQPILACGGVFSQAPTLGHALLLLLDGLQPLGVTDFLLDQNSLAASLGAIASFNAILPVQVLESGAFLLLGRVICPVTEARYGTPVVRVKIVYEQGKETTLEVAQGTISALPVQPGQTANLYLQGLNRTLLDPYTQKSSLNFKVVGGACGVVIDARGRPLPLPPDDARRRDLMKKWAMSLGS